MDVTTELSVSDKLLEFFTEGATPGRMFPAASAIRIRVLSSALSFSSKRYSRPETPLFSDWLR